MTAQPRVSIVTISFNQAQFVERAILSVLEQDYPHIEYIVVDPGSTDGSREIIDKYRDRIARIIFESDDGPADDLNKGFAKASGEIYGFLNSENRSNWDGELFIDMAICGNRFSKVDEFWSAFRLHEQSITASKRLDGLGVFLKGSALPNFAVLGAENQ